MRTFNLRSSRRSCALTRDPGGAGANRKCRHHAGRLLHQCRGSAIAKVLIERGGCGGREAQRLWR